LQFQFKTQVSRGKCVRCQQRQALLHDEAVEVNDNDQLDVQFLHLPPCFHFVSTHGLFHFPALTRFWQVL
jgi:hypothetical protein